MNRPTQLASRMDDEISLKELILKVKAIFKYLLSKWKIIFLAGIIGGGIGLAYVWNQKPIYKAQYSFVLEDEKSGGLSGSLGLASQFGLIIGGSGGGVFSGDNLMELMKSMSLVQKALLSPITKKGKTQSLIEYYIDFSELREGWADNPMLSKLNYPVNSDPSKFSRVQDSILMNIHQTLSGNLLSVGKIDKRSSIIQVQVKSTDELFAKTFTEALVNEASRFYVETVTKKANDNVAILQYQTDSVRGVLNRAIAGIAESSDNTLNLNAARQVLRTPSQRKQIDVQTNLAILTELVKNLEMSKLSLRRETPLIQVIDKPRLPLTKERFGKKNGLVLGGLLAGIMTIFYFLIKMFWENISK